MSGLSKQIIREAEKTPRTYSKNESQLYSAAKEIEALETQVAELKQANQQNQTDADHTITDLLCDNSILEARVKELEAATKLDEILSKRVPPEMIEMGIKRVSVDNEGDIKVELIDPKNFYQTTDTKPESQEATKTGDMDIDPFMPDLYAYIDDE